MKTMNEERAWEREAVAYVLTRDGEVCYEADDGIVISNTPGDETDLYKWQPVYFGAAWQRAQWAVPDGYALVPVEPTPAMRVIGARDCSSLIQPDQAVEVWRAMLGAVVVPAEYAFAATPAHPAERQEQEEAQRLREALTWLRGAINCTAENDVDQCGAWISTKHPMIQRIDELLAASTGQEVES